MNHNELDRACEHRLKQIHQRLSNEQPPYPPPHTVTLARAVHVLAMRTLNDDHPAKYPLTKSYISNGRHGLHRYWITVFRINEAVNLAAQTDALRLRDRLTGLPIQEWHTPSKVECSEWERLAIFPNADRQASDHQALELLSTFRWALLAPHFNDSVIVSLKEFDAWAASTGIAEAGGVSELLHGAEEQMAMRARITEAAHAAEDRGEKFDLSKFKAEQQPAPAQSAATPAPDELDYSLLATPAELIDAYGKWGLKIEWFDDLNSRKWLAEARRQKGQGTQGQVRKPLFCPYAVMTGLVEKVRKENRIRPDTAWRTLEHKFPRVHAAFADYDTRERTGD